MQQLGRTARAQPAVVTYTSYLKIDIAAAFASDESNSAQANRKLSRMEAGARASTNTSTSTHKHTNTQTQKHKHTNTETQKHRNTETQKHTNTQKRKRSHTHTQTHTDTHTHTLFGLARTDAEEDRQDKTDRLGRRRRPCFRRRLPSSGDTGPVPGAKDRAHIFTTLHLGLDLIPHVPETGPNPHYLAHSTRTRRLTTGPVKHCGSPVYSRRVCVCVCVCVNAWTWRSIACRGHGLYSLPCPTKLCE